MSGNPPTMFRRGAVITPAGAITPPFWTGCYVFDDRTGTPVAGDTFPSYLSAIGQAAVSLTKTAVVAIPSAGATYGASGGIVNTSGSCYLDVIPTSDELTTLQQKLDMAQMQAGETLMVGATFDTPAGWAAAHSSTHTIFSFGNFASGSASGGLECGISGAERPQVLAWAKGATAQFATAIAPDCGFCTDSARQSVVWEIQCAAANTFQFRMHRMSDATGATSSAWSTAYNLSDAANAGTAAPGCGTFGVRMLRRNGTTTNNAQRGETHRMVWWTRLPGGGEGVAARACMEQWFRPADLPRAIRAFAGDVAVYTGADGNADNTIGDIALPDMFVRLDHARAITAQPVFSIEALGGAYKSSGATAPFASAVGYVSAADFEGQLRADLTRKVGRVLTGPRAGYWLFSGDKRDTSANRGRAEAKWQGSNVELTLGVEYWYAGRYYFDFMTDASSTGQLVFFQLFAGYTPSDSAYGIGPIFTMSLDQTNERLWLETRSGSTTPTLPADVTKIDHYPAAFATPELFRSLLQREVNIVAKLKPHYDVAQSPRAQVWIDGVQVLDYSGPFGYRGPKGGADAKSTAPLVQLGCYPTSPTMVPNTSRDIYIKNPIFFKNVGGYSEPVARAALTA